MHDRSLYHIVFQHLFLYYSICLEKKVMSNLVGVLLTGYDMISISKRFSYIGAKGIRKEMEVEVEW